MVKNTCLLQYNIATGEDTVEFEVQNHGSDAHSKPFFPCEKSLLKTMKECLSKEPLRTVYESVWKGAGGPSRAENIAKLPRSRQQVYHAKGFITDGEFALHESLKEGLINARGLRSFAYFQRNCIDRLNSIGIKKKKRTNVFHRLCVLQKRKE